MKTNEQSISGNTEASALGGLRVVELADERGAYCGKLLADLGADVIKVEPPAGCPTRSLSPIDPAAPDSSDCRSLFFLCMNTNKRSLALDLESERGRAILDLLLDRADVLIEAMDRRRLERMGLSDFRPVDRHRRLIHVAISDFGRRGPRAGWRGSDLVASALGGALYVTGERDDPPVALAGMQAYQSASLVGASAALVALRERSRSGCGQFADISIQEAVASVSHICGVGKWLDDGIVPVRNGSSLFASVPSGAYQCRDGLIYLMVNRPAHWHALAEWICEVTGIDEVRDPLFEGPSANRIPYRDLLDVYIGELMKTLTVAEAFHEGQRRHIAITPVSSAGDVVSDEHLAARRFFVEVEHPGGNRLPYPGDPYRLAKTPWRIAKPAPRIGEHTREILCDELSVSSAEFAELVETGVVACAEPDAGKQASSARHQDVSHDSGTQAPATARSFSEALAGTGEPKSMDDAHGAHQRADRPAPLGGVRVLEFTAGMAGPWIGRFMAWCGAEVIRVESHTRPDVVRLYVPPWDPGHTTQPTMSPWFTDWNAGKRFLALDLTKPEAVRIARHLAARCDVVVDNYSSGVLDKLGLGYQELSAEHPELVMLSTTGYGASGPYRGYVTWGPNIEAASGLASLSGFPHRDLTITQFAYPDAISALHGLVAVLAALRYRDRSGHGQWIDIAQIEATAALVGPLLMQQAATGQEPRRLGNRSPNAAPQGCYRCRGEDRWCAISVTDDDAWTSLCSVIGRPDLARDARLATAAGRFEHADALDEAIEAWTRTRDAFEVMEALEQAGIAAGVVQTVEDLYHRDPQLSARGFFETIEHLTRGRVVATGIPLGLTATPGSSGRSGARVGEDNEYVLKEILGMSREQIDRAIACGAVEPPRPHRAPRRQ